MHGTIRKMRDNAEQQPSHCNQAISMDFSTHTTSSLHQIKAQAIGVGVFADGILDAAADVIDRASQGAVRAAVKSEFSGRPGTTLVLRALPGVTAARVILVGLGKQSDYNARTHAKAEQALASACVSCKVTDAVSTLAAIACNNSLPRERARATAMAVGQAVYYFDATFGNARC